MKREIINTKGALKGDIEPTYQSTSPEQIIFYKLRKLSGNFPKLFGEMIEEIIIGIEIRKI